MMTLLISNPPSNISALPLFNWAAERIPSPRNPVPLAARILGRRHHLSPAYAALVAELAGYAMEVN
jgi:hypothetical protein